MTAFPKDEGTLSVRSYTLAQTTHAHDFHQIVVPLAGAMTIAFDTRTYRVGVGHGVIIAAGTVHSYSAPENSRFLVADMADMPANTTRPAEPCVAISPDLLAFCTYADVQLTKSADPETAALLYALFCRLVELQDFAARVDERIMRAVMLMEQDLSASHPVERLAREACLSVSQFKTLFRKGLGQSSAAWLLAKRMERAKTLLIHTDYPVSVVAMEVGYDDASAFARRFRSFFGQSPRSLMRGS